MTEVTDAPAQAPKLLSLVPKAEAKQSMKDFKSDQEVRWCPGCGDYAVLAAVQGFMPELGLAKENIVFVSGIGCSSRFPYYMNTYGMHSIHGRAPAIATGLATSRRDLSVWVVTGDGDALSIGGNHLIHALRRNVNLKILLFNNRIYGLTKGQYSPTSEVGKLTKSSPMGSLDAPFNPVSLAIGAEASFVARTVDSDRKHLTEVLRAAADHQGTALVEIYQNCNIFNDGAFEVLKDQEQAQEAVIRLEHGKPIRFGIDLAKGVIRDRATGDLQVVQVTPRTKPTSWSTTRTPRHRPTPSRSPASPTPTPCTTPPSVCSAASNAPSTTPRWPTSSTPPSNSTARATSAPSSPATTTGPSSAERNRTFDQARIPRRYYGVRASSYAARASSYAARASCTAPVRRSVQRASAHTCSAASRPSGVRE